MITSFQKGAILRAKAMSVPKKLYSPFIRLIDRWRKSSGPEWTVDRLKAIKLDIIRRKAGLDPVSTWVKTGKTRFSGIPGNIEKWMSLSDKNFSRGIQLLQIYTLFISKSLTKKQKEKFLTAVQSTCPSEDILSLAKDIISEGVVLSPVALRWRKLSPPEPLVDMVPSPSRRAPIPGKSVSEIEGIIDSLSFLFESDKGFKHYVQFKHTHYHPCMDTLWDLLRDPESRASNKDAFKPMKVEQQLLVGRIGLIQEPGFKLRAVANPGRVFQRVLKPLGDAIYSYLKLLPWDCTFDQNKAFPAVQEALTNHKIVHSIDLSNATDYFPLGLQEHLLRKIFPSSDVDLFCSLSQGSWYMPSIGNISWSRGQPLGLYPSFGCFALTHGLLLQGLLGKEWDNHFFVLGDDVVILDDALAQKYSELMHFLGCPISESKSLSSKFLAEFGGKIITPNQVISQYKWRNVSDESFIDIAKILGHRSLFLFRPRQRQVLESIGPIPEFLGGLGWNPEGRPLEERISLNLSLLDKRPVDHLMDYSYVQIKNLISSSSVQRCMFGKYTSTNILYLPKHTDLDQRSSSLIRKLIGKGFCNFSKRLLGKNIDVVSLNLFGVHADLPINVLDGETLRPSLLQMMEAKVHQTT